MLLENIENITRKVEKNSTMENCTDTLMDLYKLLITKESFVRDTDISVAISEDKLNLVVGDYYGIVDGVIQAGRVYTYTRDTINSDWIKVSTLIDDNPSRLGWFGMSVSMTGDGLNLVVGVPYKDVDNLTKSGIIYTYTRPSTKDDWTKVSKLTPHFASDHDQFGSALSLSDDGLCLVTSSENKEVDGVEQAGLVYTYTRIDTNSDWMEVSRLSASDASDIPKISANDVKENDRFGHNVSLSKDGLFLVVTTHSPAKGDLLYVYNRSNNNATWLKILKVHY